tara:strand:- start:91 stop:507 length:417 start_codon:yes stop_codon:yes gene_type:complete
MKTLKKIQKSIAANRARSKWSKAVQEYALEILEDLKSNPSLCAEFDEGTPIRERDLLSGASDWLEYSYGGCSLIYNQDIAERLCTPSEYKKTKQGASNPNAREDWMQCQARALRQASKLVLETAEIFNIINLGLKQKA